MDSFELAALAIGAGVIALAIVVVLVFPKLGGDPTKAAGSDGGSGD
jgi:hypothetical protein